MKLFDLLKVGKMPSLMPVFVYTFVGILPTGYIGGQAGNADKSDG